ncbi:MAG TPA: hypothetical protein VNT55_20620 [Baekduia sp.]|nr:hypothetical protein [Baekduia sp.]
MILREPGEIDRYLRQLREQDRATVGAGDDAVAFTRVLETHTVVMDHGGGEPVEESLATWLSLLDHEEWRGRVREVRAVAI